MKIVADILNATMWMIIAAAMFLSIARMSCFLLRGRAKLFFCEDDDTDNR